MPDACTSTALHDCAFAGDALRCGELDGLADARWSNFDELSPPALAHPSDALLTALLISRWAVARRAVPPQLFKQPEDENMAACVPPLAIGA